MTLSKDTFLPPRKGAIAPEYLEAYAEADAQTGQPNPRFKQSSIYTSRYLAERTKLVDFENLTDTELDLLAF
ncbi:hypothetical protein PN498_04865 [Oscillatoria sp. CS-180]|uniref:hypothetical protein n=1 Tax=Oscillatoria sp. CS-180 TaxID=3021720 RepID=UPI00232B8010|nr:hypothetical protein [Oscillatoria sp. CS-180]MDB9525309.1 hypothetical protein [Oscillatoria sp. CS-180]